MKKLTIISGITIFCLIGAFILFLPSMLSTKIGKDFLIQILEKKTQAHIQLETGSFSWKKGQELKKFRMEREGEFLFTFDSLTLNVSFWNLFFRDGSLGNTHLINPSLTLQPKILVQPLSKNQVTAKSVSKEQNSRNKTLWSNPSGKLTMQNGMIVVKQDESDLIYLNQIDFVLNREKNSFPLSIQAKGNTRDAKFSGSFDTNITISEKEHLLAIDGQAHLNHFPVRGIDSLTSLLFPSLRGILEEIFGDHLNLNISLSKARQGEILVFDLLSPRMQMEFDAYYENGQMRLTKPMHGSWVIHPFVIKFFKPNLPATLIGNLQSNFTLDRATLLFKAMKPDIKSLAATGHVQIQRGAFSLIQTKDPLLLDNLTLSFQTQELEKSLKLSFQNTFRFTSFPQTALQATAQLYNLQLNEFDLNARNFPTNLIDQMTEQEQSLQKWVGSHFDLIGKYLKDGKKRELTLACSSPILKLERAQLEIDHHLSLMTPATFSYQLSSDQWSQLSSPTTLTGSIRSFFTPLKKDRLNGSKSTMGIDLMLKPNQINPILKREENSPILAEKASLALEMTSHTFPSLEGKLKVTGSINSLKMISAKTRFPFSFRQIAFDFSLDKKNQKTEIDLKGEGEKGEIKWFMQSHLGKGNLFENATRAHLKLSQLSSQIVDSLFHMEGTLPHIIGPQMDVYYDMNKSERKLSIKMESPYLSLSGNFSLNDKLELENNRKPLKIQWDVSEEGYQAYKRWKDPKREELKNSPFIIKDRATINLSISPLALYIKTREGLFPKVDFNLFHAVFDANIKVHSLAFKKRKEKKITELENFDLQIGKDTPAGALTFDMKGTIVADHSSGQVAGKGTLIHFLSPFGKLNLEHAEASIKASVKTLPSVFLDALSNMKDPSGIPPSAFLGNFVNASLEGELVKKNGTLSFDIDATNCRALVNGSIRNGIFYLDSPLKASMTISPKMNEILSKNGKIFVASTKRPISLIVDQKGFSVPIQDFSLKHANLSYGRIDFGDILCRNTGSASDLMTIFKTKKDQTSISLWFAPMEFNIRNGLMLIDRTEILYQRSYQIALWGDINFRRRFLSMTLGLTEQSLRTALGIKGLDPSYVLQIPVEGPFGNIQIDKGAATSKIALLMARKQIVPQTGVWGQVFGTLGELTDDQSKVPPPRPPFPWQSQ